MRLNCRACGLEVDPLGRSPWACPNRGTDGADHVLVVPTAGAHVIDLSSENPFVRYRSSLASHRAAMSAGVTDAAFVELVEELDVAVGELWGSGFSRTPTMSVSGVGVELVVKDETGNVSGSHKGRHLMGLAIWLRLRESLGIADPGALAIASCGNGALAAATIAAALGRPQEVFVPDWANPLIVNRLHELGAIVRVCRRDQVQGAQQGDPCVIAFRAAVHAGAVPFGCSGPDVGLTIDGGRTLGWELAEDLSARGGVERVYVQVGGGALATSVLEGLADGVASASGAAPIPVTVVQTAGCAPFDRAWRIVREVGLDAGIEQRATVMWPWESEPTSAATGILDDETYDWAGIADGLLACDGDSIVVDESDVSAANELARELTGIDVEPTGSAGLAGVIAAARAEPPSAESRIAVVFTGAVRHGAKVSG